MPIEFTFTPPTVDPGTVVHGLIAAAETAGAEALLAASQPLVPVESGDLKASGKVTHDGHGAAVTYSATNETDGFNYAARQEMDETLHHPNGGQAHFLGDSMHHAAADILAAMIAKMRL